MKELPLNIHLLTLQSLGSGSYLLRLEHQFEADEAPWNESVTLSLAVRIIDLFMGSVSHCSIVCTNHNIITLPFFVKSNACASLRAL